MSPQPSTLGAPLRCDPSHPAPVQGKTRRRRGIPHSPLPTPHPAGATLTEVLMALLVMSIGVVSLAVLFPISILRSVQATQMTNARILRDNAEARLDTLPHLVHDPDNDADFAEHFRTQQARQFVVDPLGWMEMWELNLPDDPNGRRIEHWFGNRLVRGQHQAVPIIRRWNGFFPYNLGQRANLNANQQQLFKNQAARTVTLPDSWVLHFEEIPVQIGPAPTKTVRLDSDIDLTGVPFSNGESRIVFFDLATGRRGQVRTITNITQRNTVSWDDGDNQDQEALPAGFQVERVRIETQERRYTWFLTVRKKRSNSTNVDVVVAFRRTFGPEDEHIYENSPNTPRNTAEFLRAYFVDSNDFFFGHDQRPGVAGADDDGNGETDYINGDPTQPDPAEIGFPGSDDNRTVRLQWTTAEPSPLLKRGSWILDVQNLRWYQIQDVPVETDTSATLIVDEDIVQNGLQGAILMRGIVHVFPLLR